MQNALRIPASDTFSTSFVGSCGDIDKILAKMKEKVLSLPEEYKETDAQITIEIAVNPHNWIE